MSHPGQTFESRMRRMPAPFEVAQGDETRARMPDLSPALSDLVHAVASFSPFLKSLLEQEADWLPAVFENPETAFDQLLKDLPVVEDGGDGPVPGALRLTKGRVALLVALADLAGVWTLEDVTGHLSRFADAALGVAMRAGLIRELKRDKIPGMTEADLAGGAGMVVLAMGKLGAHELNYSSDIDLICVFDDSRFDSEDLAQARAGFIRATRSMTGYLSDRTAQGYVFRTDLRLRPDPSVTPVCLAMAAAETYYESVGRTWERAAFIKARSAAGDIVAGQDFLRILQPFVWRRHLDYAAIEDAHNIRLRIRSKKNTGRDGLDGRNIKLGRGGIREIEFFTQTRQLIAGGRDPDLRVAQTLVALDQLAAKDWVPAADAAVLTEHYHVLRDVEHRLQMVHDAQTQTLPNSHENWTRLAAMMGMDAQGLRSELGRRLSEVHALTEGFFAPDAQAPRMTPSGALDDTVIARWPSYPALRSDRAVSIFNRLRPDILSRLARAAHPEEALRAFDGFLAGLPAGVQVFSLFEANPQLIDLLIDIVGTAPDLAAYLSQNAGVFDAVIAGEFFAPWPGPSTLATDLDRALARETDYEARLVAARRWLKDWHFRVGVHHLRGLTDTAVAARQYADLAGTVLRGLWPEVCAQLATRHGPPPGRGAVVLGMGSLGAGQLNATSDLDLILIYDADGEDCSTGRRPLAARAYYARVTQALITALSAPMAEGKLYEVDMRLRPSGNQGPVATSWTAFQNYQSDEAWMWEHLALTRARVVAGDGALADKVESFRRTLLGKPRDRDEVLRAVAAMRARLAEAKTPAGVLDIKPGAGGLQDIELIAQAGCLVAGHPSADLETGLRMAGMSGLLTEADAQALSCAHRLFRAVLQISRLISHKPLDMQELGEGARDALLRETGFETLAQLQNALIDNAAHASDVIDAVIARTAGGQDDQI